MLDNKRETDYFNLLNSGMFWELYPQLSGNWKEDKKEFIQNEEWLDENFRNKMENNLPTGHTLPWPEPQIAPTKATPVLVLYLDISRVENIQDSYDFAQQSMKKYEKFGWTYLIIGIDDGRNSFIESHCVERLDPIEFKELETKILEQIKNRR